MYVKGTTLCVQMLTSNRSPLQAAFMRGQLDIARHLLLARADLEYIDSDGFTVLSYLWIVEGPVAHAKKFLELCSTQTFRHVNVTDSRG